MKTPHERNTYVGWSDNYATQQGEFCIDPPYELSEYERWLDSLDTAEFLDAIDASLEGRMPEGFTNREKKE